MGEFNIYILGIGLILALVVCESLFSWKKMGLTWGECASELWSHTVAWSAVSVIGLGLLFMVFCFFGTTL